jgi:hypothetical protein
MTLDDLDGRLFASTTEAAAILDGLDPRTVRRAIAAGDIPGRRVGNKLLVPVSWLREQVAGGPGGGPSDPGLDLDQLADKVADRVAAKVFGAFASLAQNVTTAGPSPGPAAAAADSLPAKEQVRAHHNPAG